LQNLNMDHALANSPQISIKGFWSTVPFVEHYNHQRYPESLNNVTPADTYFGRAASTITQRERIKKQTIEYRRLQHRKPAD